eukprot:616066-Pyramimonas_sp.AAC.1
MAYSATTYKGSCAATTARGGSRGTKVSSSDAARTTSPVQSTSTAGITCTSSRTRGSRVRSTSA